VTVSHQFADSRSRFPVTAVVSVVASVPVTGVFCGFWVWVGVFGVASTGAFEPGYFVLPSIGLLVELLWLHSVACTRPPALNRARRSPWASGGIALFLWLVAGAFSLQIGWIARLWFGAWSLPLVAGTLSTLRPQRQVI
jgi:hypothetical protein